MASAKTKPFLDQAFVDRAEELGIKDLLVALAASLTSTRNAAAVNRMQASEAGYLIATVRMNTCTCGALNLHPGQSMVTSSIPLQPHTDTCAWSRYVLLFGDDVAKREFNDVAVRFRAWAKQVSEKPDDQPYRNVVVARHFLEREEREKKS